MCHSWEVIPHFWGYTLEQPDFFVGHFIIIVPVEIMGLIT